MMRINLCWTPIYYVYLNGKRYYFEFGPYVGVTILNQKTGEPTERQDAPAGFWPKFEAWKKRRKF